MRDPASAVGALAATGIGALAYASLVERNWYALREATVPVLPTGAPPLRVLHISDLHLTPSQRRKSDWVRDLASLKPDLVVDTGDNIAHADGLRPVLDALEPLLSIPGAFVMGSNDYFAPRRKNPVRYLRADARDARPVRLPRLPAGELAAEFVRAGWRDLTNTRDSVEISGRAAALVGVDDPHLNRDRFPVRPPESAPPAGAPSTEPELRIGVTHAPYLRVLDAMLADGSDLILAGHTHGGQLAVPFYGALVTNCDLDRGRAKGLHGWPGARPDTGAGQAAHSTWLHVSAGLGTSPYAPVRFACRPEATLLTLVGR